MFITHDWYEDVEMRHKHEQILFLYTNILLNYYVHTAPGSLSFDRDVRQRAACCCTTQVCVPEWSMWTFPTCFKRNIHIYKSTVHIYVFTVDMILIHLRAVKVNLNYFPDKLRTSSTYKVKINVCHRLSWLDWTTACCSCSTDPPHTTNSAWRIITFTEHINVL